MQQFDAAEAVRLGEGLTALGALCAIPPPQSLAEAKESYGHILQQLRLTLALSDDVGLRLTRKMIEPLYRNLVNDPPKTRDFPDVALCGHINNICQLMRNELADRVFLHIPEARAKYYNMERPFGDKVFQHFCSARTDAVEAARCFACARWTACVFHLTRVLEVGLRVLAKTSEAKPDANWGGLIKNIGIALESRAKSTSLSNKERAAFSSAAGHFDNIRTGWRNPTNHAEAAYNEQQALAILNSTGAFLQTLADVLKEAES